MTQPAEHPETGRMEHRLTQVGAALDAFLHREADDPLPRRGVWGPALGGALPPSGLGPDEVMRLLTDLVVPNGGRYCDPGFWGWITVGPTTMPVAAMAAGMVAAPQRYSLTAFNALEETALRWLADLCGLGTRMGGVLCSGGSTANLIALGAARQWALEAVGEDPSRDGLSGRPVAVYASQDVHHTVHRALGVLGLGRRSVVAIPTDGAGRMRSDLLEDALDQGRRTGVLPLAVVACAGSTDTGAVDPLRAVGSLARQAGAWFHVDGAYGLPGILDPRVAPLYDGLDLADSAIVDPHKWLGAPVGIAAAFVRDRDLLARAFMQEPADYLDLGDHDGPVQCSLDTIGVNYADWGVELSAPSRGVAVWALLSEIGREGMRRRIVADNDRARRVADAARRHPRLELMMEPTLSVVCFRYRSGRDPDGVNREIVRRLLRTTPWVASSTVIGGAFVIRPCFVNARTRDEHVDAFMEAVVEIGDVVEAEQA